MATIQEILRKLVAGEALSEAESESALSLILEGQAEPSQVAAILSMIAARPGGPTVDELVGGAKVMRRHVTRVEVPRSAHGISPNVIDTCGTGGAPKTFNVSTAAAIVAPAAAPGRVMVAKHGSRSRSGRGSAEVLERLGVNVAASPEIQSRCLAEVGLSFSFAIHHHPAMKHAAPVRAALGFPTILNLLGPLTNPAGARRQLVGTYSEPLALKLAQTLARLGADHAIVVTSQDGMDELTTTAPNILFCVREGSISRSLLDAADVGLAPAWHEQLTVASLDEAAGVIRAVLEGRPGPARDIVLLNAGAALVVADAAPDIAAGVSMAAAAVDSGRARSTLDQLVALTNIPSEVPPDPPKARQ